VAAASAGADGAPAALRSALAHVGDRWTLLVVQALLDGPRRFNELQHDLGGIAPNILSQRLRQLESDRLVLAQPYSEHPRRFAYELTGSGAELAGALRLLAQWGADRAGHPGEVVVHAACGTPAEARWWCPTCDRSIEDEELDELRWV
jgi:DNA-binding HxlR family transcriptional regulator